MASSNSLRLVAVTTISVSFVGALFACGGSTADPNDSDSDSGILLVDSGARSDAAAPSDAGAPNDASTITDAGSHVDAGIIQASFATDFSAATNPNGSWTYGYSLGAPGGDASALVVYQSTTTQGDVDCWYDQNNVALGAPAACYNGSAAATSTGVDPGEAALHPGQNGEYSIARWTASVAGAYVVHVQFKAGDQGETNGMLVHDGVVLWSVDMTSTNPTDDRTVTMAAGDTLDVAVGNDGDFLYDTTPTIFTIRSAP